MGVARVGSMFGIGVLLAMVGAAPATTSAAAPPTTVIKPSVKVAISPEYTTAGEPTTFRVTIVNTSPSGNTLGSVKISPPSGFSPPRPTATSPLRNKTKVKNRSLMLQQVTVKPGKLAHLTVTATAPGKCGSATTLHWSSQAFVGQNGGGTRLGLSAASKLDVKVLCPDTMPCAVGAVACHTSLTTSNSTYTVMSDATSGTLTQTVNVGKPLRCGGYHFKDPNWYDSAVSAPTTSPPTTAPTPIIDTITYKIRNAKAEGTGFCLGVAYEFTTASGAPARAGSLPNGNQGFIGLLPSCSAAKPPCIASTTQQANGSPKVGFDVLMTIQIPETGDPWGAG